MHFPLACWVLATLVDLADRLLDLPRLPGLEWASGAHALLWAGVVLAVPAMIAGAIDYSRLPRPVQESTELSLHIMAMGIAWLLFLGGAIWRTRADAFGAPASWGLTLVEAGGCLCLIVGGWLASIVVFEKLPHCGLDLSS